MEKHYILFCAAIFSISTLASTATAEYDDFVEPAPMDNAYIIQSLQDQVYSIRETFRLHADIFQQFEPEIQIIITKLNEMQLDPDQIQTIQQAIARYQALADACLTALENPTHLAYMLSLFQKRANLIRQAEQVLKPCVYANLILYDLAHYLGHTPSKEEKQSMTQEKDRLILKRNEALVEINDQLFLVEQEILKDHRTWGRKYGPLLQVTGILLGCMIGIGVIVNTVHSYTTKK